MIRERVKRLIGIALERTGEGISSFGQGLSHRDDLPADGAAPAPRATAYDGGAMAGEPHASPPVQAAERRAFIRERLASHKWEYLRYEVGLLGVKHRVPTATVRELLRGQDVRDAAPTLRLDTENWAWRAGEIERIILEEAGGLQLTIPAGGSLVDARASRACRDWARAEAQRRVDRALAGTARGT